MPLLPDNDTAALGETSMLPAVSASPEGTPSFKAVAGAAFRTENAIGSLLSMERRKGSEAAPTPDYDPFQEDEGGILPIAGYEAYAERFIDVDSPASAQRVMAQIDRETKDRETLHAAGGWGIAASFAAGMLDPLVLVPVGGQIKAGTGIVKTGLRTARAGAIGAAISEGALHATQETRTGTESAVAIGGATFLSGLLGSAAKALTKAQFDGLAKRLDDEVISPIAAEAEGGSVGAKVSRDTTFEQESLVGAVGSEKALKGLSPLTRLSQSPSIETRRALQDIADIPLELKKNAEGIITPVSAETEVRRWDAQLGDLNIALDRLYVQYRTGESGGRVKRNAIGLKDMVAGKPSERTLSYSEFKQAVGQAARREDKHDIPEIAEAASLFRKTLADPIKNEAIAAKLLPEDVEVTTADSYFPRLYDVPLINAKRSEFKAIIIEDLAKQKRQAAVRQSEIETDLEGFLRAAERKRDAAAIKKLQTKLDGVHQNRVFSEMDDVELEDIAEQIIDHIVGTPAGRIPRESVTLHRGPLKERVFQISDYDIEEYLLDDVAVVASAHVRTVVPDVALAKRFGEEIDAPFGKIEDDYQRLIDAAKTEKEKSHLAKAKEADLRDLGALRDRLRGTYLMPADPTHWAVRSGRLVRNWNFLRMLGGVTISSFTDVARPVMTEGLWRTFSTGLRPMMTGFRAVKLSGKEARLAGTAWDMALDTRALNLAELGSDFNMYSKLDRAGSAASSAFSIASLISPWTAFMKDFSSAVIGTRILETATKWADTGKLTKKYISMLSQSGIDQYTAERIAQQFKLHGEKHRGAWLPNTQKWDDRAAVQAFRDALAKDIDKTIITPGIADRPLWMSHEVGKILGQFRTFAFAATNRMMLAGMQKKDMAVLNGALLSIAVGSGVYGLKSAVAGRETSDDPKVWLAEGMDRSGLLGILMDVNNVAEKATGGVVGISAITGTEGMSRYAVRNDIGALLGPTAGTLKDALTVTKLAAGGELKQSDIRAARRLLPFQNLFYLRWLLNQVEEEAGQELEAKGR